MCQTESNASNPLGALVRQAMSGSSEAGDIGALPTIAPPPQSSRRRRLWELEGHAHCPVIGVCLPIAALRRLVDKVLDGQAVADDYELHCGVVTDCKRRSPIADAVQRELDRRYLRPLGDAAKAKTTETLTAWWDAALHGDGAAREAHIAGPLWATLTHARCTPALEQRVLGEIHMLQHQAGMAARVDQGRFEAVIDENAVLTRELAALRSRLTRQAAEQAERIEAQQAQIVRLRAELITRDTAIAQKAADLQALEAAVPGLKSRFEMARAGERQLERSRALQCSLAEAQQEAGRQRRRADALAAGAAATREPLGDDAPESATHHDDDPAAPATPTLDDRAVLCVGGRPAAVPLYRHLVERSGGRFLHHDGGEEESSARLDATLASADLVICQTGCISHNAYWRVKDHCKRTGKRCVFVESPSSAGLKRALASLVPIDAAESTA